MLIPSISKAKTNHYGIRSSGTYDYRHGAKIRPNKLVLNGISNEVLKKIEHYVLEAPMLVKRAVHGKRKQLKEK
jgi:hypothetical protein